MISILSFFKSHHVYTSKQFNHLFFVVSIALFVCLIFGGPFVQSCSNFHKSSKIKLSGNGYTHLLVSIDENVVENHYLIERIKDSFSKASKLLYNATRHRFYFKEIIILVPSSWSIQYYIDDFNDDNNGKLASSSWEMHDRADVCIETRSESSFDTPFTFNYNSKCGEMGDHMHFTPDYFLKQQEMINLFGKYENMLVHEWAHYRYGVFDEHPYKTTDADDNEEFYLNSNGEIEATKCNSNLSGKLFNPFNESSICETDPLTGLPSKGCVFEDDVIETTNGETLQLDQPSSSLMYKPHLDHLTEFCDNDPDKPETFHNKFAPTMQNKECQGQSVWEVLRSHKDFRNFQAAVQNIFQTDHEPQFKLVRKSPKRIVLLIDKSVTLQSPSNYFHFKSALRDYINIVLNDEDYIGVIHFEKNAKIVLPMTQVSNTTIRKTIFEKAMPSSFSDDSVNIWNALSLGLSLLKNNPEHRGSFSKTGGNFVLITGATADPKYPIRSLISDSLAENRVTIDTIRIGEDSDQTIDYLALNSDGNSFQINDLEENSHIAFGLQSSLVYLSRRETNPLNQVAVLVDSSFALDSTSNRFTGSFKIDKYVSEHYNSLISVKFVFTNFKTPFELAMFEPDNAGTHRSKYLTDCVDYYLLESSQRRILNDSQEIICKFQNPARGIWSYEITNPDLNENTNVHFTVLAAFHNAEDPSTQFPYYYRTNTKKRKDKNVTMESRLENLLRIDAKWSKAQLKYPEEQVIYAKLSKNLMPILNATVKAVIYRPSGSVVTLELYDNGLGSDRFKDDGIYSRNFLNYEMDGVYHSQIFVETTYNSYIHRRKIVGSPNIEHYPSTGTVSKLPSTVIEPTDEFTRIVYMEPFKLSNYKDEDLIKPSRIKDLRITEFNAANQTLTLSFTAPGNDGDVGTAAYYDIKAMYDPEILIQYEDMEYSPEEISRVGKFQLMKDQPQHTLNEYVLPIDVVESTFENFEPNQGGYEETLTIKLSKYSQDTVSIRMRAIDHDGNVGAWSHIVTYRVNNNTDHKLSARIEHYSHFKSSRSSHLIESSKHSSPKERFYWKFSLAIIVLFVAVGFLQLIIAMAVVVMEVRERYKQAREQEREREREREPFDPMLYGPYRV